MKPRELPVYQHRDRILSALADNAVVVVESPTGSGKTTQIPIILHEAGYSRSGVIGVTQPRRIAALSVCDYVARQLDTSVPGMVGYKMRFEDQTSLDTRIKVMTDGILLQELKADPDLAKYSVIMVDEAHERSLNIDFVLGLLKRILKRRSDLKVVISSATINAEVFSEYFDECPVIRIEAGMYPVEVEYRPPRNPGDADELTAHITRIVEEIVGSGDRGDVLIFLQGEHPIKECLTALAGSRFSKQLFLIPLYGRLGKEEQERVFVDTPPGRTKVVVSTNIAETSVTIDGITSVIDSGLCKLNHYNPKTFTSSLIESPISKASCNQRKGRAGRTAPGRCYRLYAPDDYESRPLFTTEEIYRTDLSEVVLRMAELGIRDFESFDFLSPPERRDIAGAVETLRMLDAINEDNTLTSMGEMMARFPLLPRHARVITESIHRYPSVIEESLVAAAFLSAHTPLILPPGEEAEARKAHHGFRNPNGDFVSYLTLLKNFRGSRNRERFCTQNYLDVKVMSEIDNIAEQLSEIVSEMGVPLRGGGPIKDYLCAVSRGLIQFVCMRSDRSDRSAYRNLTTERIYIHPGSVMFRKTPEFIVAGEIIRTSRMFARSVSPIEKQWLPEISELLVERLIPGTRGAGSKTKEKERDTTWQVQIGEEAFKLTSYKGKKKLAILPWDKLTSLVQAGYQADRYNKLRGKVVFKDKELFTGYKLPRIFRLATVYDPNRDIEPEIPVSRDMRLPEDWKTLCDNLPRILRLCPRTKNSGKLGILVLQSDNDRFWFKVSRGFTHALTESISAVEDVIDSFDGDEPEDCRRRVNETYRKLNDLLDK